jgi:hypothetical protein
VSGSGGSTHLLHRRRHLNSAAGNRRPVSVSTEITADCGRGTSASDRRLDDGRA